MIDYNRVSDKSYLNNELQGIKTTSESYILANELKLLSQKIYDRQIDPNIAEEILYAIKDRQEELTNKKRNERNNGGKSLRLTPTTSVSNRVGAATVAILLINVAVTVIMYMLLLTAHLIR